MKPNSTLLFIAFSLFFFSSSLFSQKFATGYIITNQNDTVSGLIEYLDWAINPREIKFKTTQKATTRSYDPTTIKGFRVKNDIYASRVVSYNVSRTELEFLSNNPLPEMETDTVFLMAYILDNVNLYFLKRPNLYKHYFIERGDSIEELIQYKHYVEHNIVSTEDYFKPTLKKYAKGCDKVLPIISDTKFYENYLVEAVLAINKECYPQKNTRPYVSRLRQGKFKWGITGGAGISMLKFRSRQRLTYDHLVYADASVGYTYNFGLKVDFISAKNFGKWQYSFELMMRSYQNTYVYDDYYLFSTEYIRNKSPLSVNSVGLNAIFRYQLGYARIRPHLLTGLGISRQWLTKNTRTLDYVGQFSRPQTTDAILYDNIGLETGIFLGAGVQVGRYCLDIRYFLGSGIARGDYGLGSSSRLLTAQLGFRF